MHQLVISNSECELLVTFIGCCGRAQSLAVLITINKKELYLGKGSKKEIGKKYGLLPNPPPPPPPGLVIFPTKKIDPQFFLAALAALCPPC